MVKPNVVNYSIWSMGDHRVNVIEATFDECLKSCFTTLLFAKCQPIHNAALPQCSPNSSKRPNVHQSSRQTPMSMHEKRFTHNTQLVTFEHFSNIVLLTTFVRVPTPWMFHQRTLNANNSHQNLSTKPNLHLTIHLSKTGLIRNTLKYMNASLESTATLTSFAWRQVASLLVILSSTPS